MIAIITYLTVDIGARLAIINAIAIAHVEALLSAVSPNGVLNEPRKCRREARIERPNIDLLSHVPDDLGATTRLIASLAKSMLGTEPPQYTSSVQKIVHQGIDGDHAAASL
jgi:hypothetical protein